MAGCICGGARLSIAWEPSNPVAASGLACRLKSQGSQLPGGQVTGGINRSHERTENRPHRAGIEADQLERQGDQLVQSLRNVLQDQPLQDRHVVAAGTSGGPASPWSQTGPRWAYRCRPASRPGRCRASTSSRAQGGEILVEMFRIGEGAGGEQHALGGDGTQAARPASGRCLAARATLMTWHGPR